MNSAARVWVWGILMPAMLVGFGLFVAGIVALGKWGESSTVGPAISHRLLVLTRNPDNERFQSKFTGEVVIWNRADHDIDVRLTSTRTHIESVDGIEVAMHVETTVSAGYSDSAESGATLSPELRSEALRAIGVSQELVQHGRCEVRIPIASGANVVRLLGNGAVVMIAFMIILPTIAFIAVRRTRSAVRAANA